jgi:GT2 family glycosyltransferase
MKTPSVSAIVVTHNRVSLLEKCIFRLKNQTLPLSKIIIINNNSTDGTRTYLQKLLEMHDEQLIVHTEEENTGGAGGFSAGLIISTDEGVDWAWLMDDDAEPQLDALEELMKIAENPANIYGSLAINGRETSWLTTVIDNPGFETTSSSDIPATARVQSLPFLGFLVHRNLVELIGFPDSGFFIAADDVEYCIRAKRAGAQIIVAGKSHIEHPKSRPYKIRLLGYTLTALELPPWKRYYDTRNRLLIARRHYGMKLYTQTIPGSLARMLAALLKEPRKLAQLRAFSAGFIDGVLGRKGRRHEAWGIKQ